MMDQTLRDDLTILQRAAWGTQSAIPDRGHYWLNGRQDGLKNAVEMVTRLHWAKLPPELQGAIHVLEKMADHESYAEQPSMSAAAFNKALGKLTAYLEGRASDLLGAIPAASSGTNLVLDEAHGSNQAQLEANDKTGERGAFDGVFPFYSRDNDLQTVRLDKADSARLSRKPSWSVRPLPEETTRYGRSAPTSSPGLPPGCLGFIVPTDGIPGEPQPANYGRDDDDGRILARLLVG